VRTSRKTGCILALAALGIRLTEGTLDSTASFWREGIRREF
jgi:hypothetical protein